MVLIPTLRSDFQMRYIFAITSIHFPKFFKILEVTVMGTVTVMGEATLINIIKNATLRSKSDTFSYTRCTQSPHESL